MSVLWVQCCQYRLDLCSTLQYTYTTLHYTTLHYTTLHYTTLHYTTLHYTTLHYTTLHYTTLHYTTLHYTTLHYTTLHYTTLHYTTLHYTTLHYTTLHYTTLHYTTLHYTTLHYTTLHYTTLHYTVGSHSLTYLNFDKLGQTTTDSKCLSRAGKWLMRNLVSTTVCVPLPPPAVPAHPSEIFALPHNFSQFSFMFGKCGWQAGWMVAKTCFLYVPLSAGQGKGPIFFFKLWLSIQPIDCFNLDIFISVIWEFWIY